MKSSEISGAVEGRFPELLAVIDDGIQKQLHTGVQVYISQQCRTLVNAGFGRATSDRPLAPDALMLWRSAGKPLTVAAILRHCEFGKLSVGQSVADVLPEWQGTPAGKLSILQLMTHQTGLPVQDIGWPHSSWNQLMEFIQRVEPNDVSAAYQPQVTWFVLGEILRTLAGGLVDFSDAIREELLRPLKMDATSCGLNDAEVAACESRIPTYFARVRGQLRESEFSTKPWITAASPGGNMWGPVSDLGTFYEMLLQRGATSSGSSYLTQDSVAEMTRPHRTGQYDATLQHTVDFGLGVIVNSNRYGPDTVPYGFGRNCSPGTFGHGGAQCAMGFCDPVRELVVAWAANGLCGEGQHQRRNRAINEAIYRDLNITA